MLGSVQGPISISSRRLLFSVADVGLSDSIAFPLAMTVYQACHFLGMPECNIPLTQAVVYLSLAPRSNSVYMAYEHAKKDALTMLSEPVPLVIRNAPTGLMKDLDYGKGYVYAHDTKDKIADMECLPESLAGTRYYLPQAAGDATTKKERLEDVMRWRAEHRKRRAA